jgi:hypothetical protein
MVVAMLFIVAAICSYSYTHEKRKIEGGKEII